MIFVDRKSNTARPSDRRKDSGNDINSRCCTSSGGAAKWGGETTKWFYQGRLLLKSGGRMNEWIYLCANPNCTPKERHAQRYNSINREERKKI